jgi:hypothetical protein
MSRRAERKEQFKKSPGGDSFSPDIIVSAHTLLELALAERKRGVWRDVHNHYTAHATSVIVLAVTALDAWLMEYILAAAFRDPPVKDIAHLSLFDRVRTFLTKADRVSPVLDELRLLIDVRDEIVHVLPRQLGPTYPLPSWLQSLDERGFMIKTTKGDFRMHQKFASYALAYWATTTAHACTQELMAVAPDSMPSSPEWLARNFARYRHISSPEQLPQFDARYKLDLTPQCRE